MEYRKPIILLVLFAFITPQVSAGSLGISPAEVKKDNMIRGGYAEQVFTVSTPEAESLFVEISATGAIKDWVRFEPRNFTLPAKSKAKFKAIFELPADVPNGNYSGMITARAAPQELVSQGAGVAVATAVAVKIELTVGGEEMLDYRLVAASARDVEEGFPVEFTATVENTGNVKAKPEIHVDVKDSAGKTVKTHVHKDTVVMPSVKYDVPFRVESTGLPVGAYSADVWAEKDGVEKGAKTVSFNIVEKGSLKLHVELVDLSVGKKAVKLGETVKIVGSVSNAGERSVSVKLKVEVYFWGNLVTALESDPTDVYVGETQELGVYFKPEKAGIYDITAVGAYSSGKTKEKKVSLDVVEEATAGGGYMLYIIIIIVVLAVILFIVLTKKRRKEKPAAEPGKPPAKREEKPTPAGGEGDDILRQLAEQREAGEISEETYRELVGEYNK